MRNHHQGRRTKAVIGKMMLGVPSLAKTELFGNDGLLHRLAINLFDTFFNITLLHDIEDSEIHGSLPPNMHRTTRSAPCPAISISLNTLPITKQRSEEHTSELQSLMRTSSAVFCLKKKH